MGISIYNVTKWIKMITGNSIMHVNQDMGKVFVPGCIKGYYNNLTDKVLKDKRTLELEIIPVSTDEKAGKVHFPIAIFQYGLGAYDLYLQTESKIYISQFQKCVAWAIENQEESGAWNNFGFVQPNFPYSSMCQGEGASLLLRAYVSTDNKMYLDAAEKAIEFMLKPIEEGGTAKYTEKSLYLYEYTDKPCVLNGWIFSIFGLYDICLATNEKKYRIALEKTVETLKNTLPQFDNGYWSKYDVGDIITSPFYHKLHIAQMEALGKTFNDPTFWEYKKKFENYQVNKINYCRAFVKKAWQKIREK